MKTQTRVQSVFGGLILALKQFTLRKRIQYYETAYQHELLHEAQAKANAQWYKLRAGRMKYQLEDLQNAAKR